MGKQENGYIILLFFFWMEHLLLCRSRGGDGVGFDNLRPESESESELLKIRRLRSPEDKAGIKQNKLEDMVEDKIESREGRKKVITW